jgi:transmembrane sensor
MNNKEQIDIIIIRHLNGEASAEEELMLEKWLEEDPANLAEYDELNSIWKQSAQAFNLNSFDTDQAWQKLSTRISPPHQRSGKLVSMKKIMAVAASLILVAGLAWISFRNTRNEEWIMVNADYNQKLTLPDQSVINLRKGSSIEYSPGFGSTDRDLRLKGEAYFDVKHDPSLPFHITTSNGEVTVLGTSFMIRSTDSIEQVFVTTGRVKFKKAKEDEQAIILTAGEKGELKEDHLVKEITTEKNHLSWKDDRLIFDKTPLKQVAADISNYYGMPVILDEEIASQNILVTYRFENQSLDTVMEEIGLTTGLHIRKEGKRIHLSLNK